MMEWPSQFLLAVLGLSVAAVFIPWFIPRGPLASLLGFIPALVACGCWAAYEMHLRSIARPVDPLIRVDLLLILPLAVLAWVSAIGAFLVERSRASRAKPGAAPDPAA